MAITASEGTERVRRVVGTGFIRIAERHALGMVLIGDYPFERVLAAVGTDDRFLEPLSQQIFDAMTAVHRRGELVHLMSVHAEMAHSDVATEKTQNELIEIANIPEPMRDVSMVDSNLRELWPDSTPIFDLDRYAPTMAAEYGVEQLRLAGHRKLVSFANLPHGHGWGEKLDQIMGGGVHAGESIAIGAASAGAGKTAFVHQLCDGLAFRNLGLLERPKADEPTEALTPVFVVSEMNAAALTWRSLSRLTGTPAKVFRAGASNPELFKEALVKAEAQFAGDFGRARAWQRRYRGGKSNEALISDLSAQVRQWSADIARRHPGRAIWPVVFIDPVQRFAGFDGSEIEQMNRMCEAMRAETERTNWILVFTSDTNKSSATGDGKSDGKKKGVKPRSLAEEGTAAFRGTYGLLHMADAVIYLRFKPGGGGSTIQGIAIKNRMGVAASHPESDAMATATFKWEGAKMKFTPAEPGAHTNSQPPSERQDEEGDYTEEPVTPHRTAKKKPQR